jgi:hypothetical protein
MNMPDSRSIKSEYELIDGFREGARFCKMDLHTHTPASECSSFTLPEVMEAAFPQKTKGKSERIFQEERYEFIKKIAGGANPFKAPYGSRAVKSFPRLGRQPVLDKSAIRDIAGIWLGDIKTYWPEDGKRATAEQKEMLKEHVNRAIEDLSRYVKSLFFPEEYVMRCYIEGLQLVAITDHNHPGYIIPRLHELGTWHSRIRAVNEPYEREILKGDPKDRVRRVILARLRLAKKRLEGGFGERSHAPGAVKEQHRDRAKKLKKIKERREHIEERIAYWKNSENKLHPLTVLPGVEITASNVHLLAVFPPQWYVSVRIASVLRLIGIPEEHWGRGFIAAASSSVHDTISLVEQEGGIVIPAHSNSDFKGLLRLFRKGLALTKVIEHPALYALETIGGTVKAGEGKKRGMNACETLRWLDTGSHRPDRSKPLCFIKGSDAHEVRIELDGTGEDLGARFTYVKLDIRKNDTTDEIFRSLRLALLSGQSRVIEFPIEDGYNYTAPAKKPYRIKRGEREKLLECERHRPSIIGLTVAGKDSYANGLRLRFNPFLNCIVGSGGKSTLVRILGYAFGLQSFMEGTKRSWLPKLVRVYWRMGDSFYCIERKGRKVNPLDSETHYYKRAANGSWKEVKAGVPDPKIVIWPSREVQDEKISLSKFEDDIISDLVEHLRFTSFSKAGPLLINQPKDIFNNQALFNSVLSKPFLKYRQIIWSTGSPNVPTALDAEKIMVTMEQYKGKTMDLVCGGDLHEDEVRRRLLAEFEGGELAFARRVTLYSM